MKKINNIVTADEGKLLKCYDSISNQFVLGNNYVLINNAPSLINITLQDIIEVYPISIDNITYYVSKTNYSELVSELIRLKYSLDDELALIANIRKGDYSTEDDFQKWRSKCKQIAKQITNE